MNSFLLRLFTLIISLYSITSSEKNIDIYVSIHIIIIAINSYSLFSYKNMPYSLFKVYHVFSLFFFGIAPVLQYHNHTRFLDEPIISQDVKLYTSLIILTSLVLYNIIYFYFFIKLNSKNIKIKKQILKLNYFTSNDKKFSSPVLMLFLFLSLISLFVILYMNNFNVLSLLFRGGEFSEHADVEKSITLLSEKFFRPLSLIIFIISFKYNRKRTFLNFILFFLFVLTCFPSGMARNATAAFYIPLLLLFVPVFKKKHVFVSFMLASVLVIFPFLNNFRRFNSNSKITIGLNYDMFIDLHFDAYLTFVRIINLDLITYGRQLLGVFFFFIPRSLWHSKPQSSGYLHADVLHLHFKNLACTFLAEGYINFGFIGVLLFLFFIAWFSAYLDKAYFLFKKRESFFNIIYILILGMFLFVLRGDLMNGYSFTFGIVFTSLFMYKILKKLT